MEHMLLAEWNVPPTSVFVQQPAFLEMKYFLAIKKSRRDNKSTGFLSSPRQSHRIQHHAIHSKHHRQCLIRPDHRNGYFRRRLRRYTHWARSLSSAGRTLSPRHQREDGRSRSLSDISHGIIWRRRCCEHSCREKVSYCSRTRSSMES